MAKRKYRCQFCGEVSATKELIYCTRRGVSWDWIIYVCERTQCVEEYGKLIREEEED